MARPSRYHARNVHEYVQQLQSLLTPDEQERLTDELQASLGGVAHGEIPRDVRVVLRWELDLCTALTALKEPADELAYWARRAYRGARQVEAQLSQKPSWGLRRELAEWRARHAWQDWDDEELRDELEAWPERDG